MLVALYVGNHAAASFWMRVGCALTRLAQKGEFGRVTHVEAILQQRGDGSVDIASAILTEGGVRRRNAVRLEPGSWIIVDVPSWDAARAGQWFADHAGEPYDSRGALATVLPGHHRSGSWFCNEAVGAAVGLREPHSFDPAQFAAMCLSFGQDVTAEFFRSRATEGAAA